MSVTPDPMYPGHRQVRVNGIEVDEKLAPLLASLWAAGYDTQFSCQSQQLPRPRSFIVFSYLFDAVRFFETTITLLFQSTPELFMGHQPPDFSLKPMAAFEDWPYMRGCVEFDPSLLTQITDLHRRAYRLGEGK